MADRGDYIGDAQWRRGFALLSPYDLSFDAQIYEHQAHDLAILARIFPETTIIIEHLRWPTAIAVALGIANHPTR
jgi:L-fuconolactonase